MKNAQIDKRIAEMKEVILGIHRSAGELDTIVQRMENVLKRIDKEDEAHAYKLFESELRHRKEMNSILGFDTLAAKEEFVWEKLIQAAKNAGANKTS